MAERLTKNLLGGHPLRNATGGDNGVRVLDVDNDGYMDVVIGNPQTQITRLWTPATRQWRETSFPVRLVAEAADVSTADAGVRFGVLHPGGSATVMVNAEQRGVWHHNGEQWLPEEAGKGVPLPPCPTSSAGCDQGVRLIDLDLDGVDELVVANPGQQAVYRLAGSAWEATAWSLPRGLVVVDSAGRDGGLRFVDLDDDGRLDLVFSNAERSAAYRVHVDGGGVVTTASGWATQCRDLSADDCARGWYEQRSLVQEPQPVGAERGYRLCPAELRRGPFPTGHAALAARDAGRRSSRHTATW